jgi:MFS family permease
LIQISALDRDPTGRARTALGISVLEGSLHAVMVGVAESYLGAFAVELHYGPREQGLLATLPLVAGALCQLFSPLLCVQLGGRKRVALAGALGQAASMAALLLIALAHTASFPALLLARIAFWVSGGVMAPAWNAWMADLTVHTDRPRYFARRSTINQVALLVAFCGAGWALERARLHVLPCFTVLFTIAFLARFCSVGALALQSDLEPPSAPYPLTTPRLWPRLRSALCRAHFRVPIYLACLAFGTQLSAPFFTPYMLQDLALDYKTFAGLSALSILAKAVTFPLCHRLAERVGLSTVLRWGGAGVALIPLVWALSTHLPALIFAHVLGGAVWGAVEYASFQLLFESAPAELTAEFFSLSSAVTGVAQVAGALCGGLLLDSAHVGYGTVFVLSGLLRVAALTLLFIAFSPQQLPQRLRWLYLRLRAIEFAAGPATQRVLLSGSELPRSLGNRTTDPPPAL